MLNFGILSMDVDRCNDLRLHLRIGCQQQRTGHTYIAEGMSTMSIDTTIFKPFLSLSPS